MTAHSLLSAKRALQDTLSAIEAENANILQQIAVLNQTLSENKHQLNAVQKAIHCLSFTERKRNVSGLSKQLVLNVMKGESLKWWALGDLALKVCEAGQLITLDEQQIVSLKQTLWNMCNAGVLERRKENEWQWRIKCRRLNLI